MRRRARRWVFAASLSDAVVGAAAAVTATDAAGQRAVAKPATVGFAVRVEFHWPARPAGGWRSLLGAP